MRSKLWTKTNAETYVPDEWLSLLECTRKRSDLNSRLMLVIGGVDSGKSTLVQYLVRTGGQEETVAWLDGDLGQSVMGPPGTLSLGMPSVAVSEGEPSVITRFVGDVSPAGNLVQVMSALLNLVQRGRANNSVDRILVDSSGFVHGKMAEEFKINLVEALKPLFLVVLEKEERELSVVADAFRADPSVEIHQPRIDAGALRQKTRAERADYRRQCFEEYFGNAERVEIDVNTKGVHGFVPYQSASSEEGRLVGLLNKDHDMLAMGVLRY